MARRRWRIGRVASRGLAAASLAFLLVASMPCAAQSVSIYRCVDASGRVALQDHPCPPGQLDRQSEVPLDPTSASPPTPAATPAPAEPSSAIREAPPPLDPPPLWRCVDFEGKHRLAPHDDPKPRYVPVWAVAGSRAGDIAGASRSSTPGQLPPMVRVEDRCRQLPPEQACRAYREQRDEARRGEYNSVGEQKRAFAAEVERLRGIVMHHCGG